MSPGDSEERRSVQGQRALAGTMARMAQLSGGRVQDADGVVCFENAAPGVGLWAGVVRTDAAVSPAEVLASANAFFAGSPRPYTVMTLASHDQDLEAHLAANGHTAVVDGPEMSVDAPMPVPAAPPGVTTEVVADEAGRRAFLDVVGPAFAGLGEDPAVWPRAYPDVDSLAGDDRAAMVVFDDGVACAGGMVYLVDAVGHVIHVGTDPDRQGQGFGSLVTAALTRGAFDRGVELVTLIATDPGEPVYRRLGYTESTRGRWWLVNPPSERDSTSAVVRA